MSPSSAPSPTDSSLAGEVGQPPFEDRPDDFFGVVAGLYAALVVAPLVTVGVARAVADTAGVYLALLAAVTVTTAVVALALRRVRGLAVRLGATSRRWLPAVLAPVPAAIVVGGLSATGGYSNLDGLLGILASVGGFSAGGVLGIMARSRYTKAVTGAAESLATWRAGWPERRRRPVQLLGAGAFVAGILAHLGRFVWHYQPLQLLGNLLIPVGAVAFTFGQPRTYRATSVGLETQLPAARSLTEWDRFEGYAVDDDALVIHYRSPWRFPVVADRSDLGDEEAVLAALEECLPRLPAR